MEKNDFAWAKHPEVNESLLLLFAERPKKTWREIADILNKKYKKYNFSAEQVRMRYRFLKNRRGTEVVIRDREVSEILDELRSLLDKKRCTIEQLADELNVPPKKIHEGIERLREQGYNVVMPDGRNARISKEPFINKSIIHEYDNKWVRFGIVSDMHICSIYHHAQALHTLYDIFEKEGITHVYSPGNVVDGEKTYRGQEYEIECWGAEGQAEAVETAVISAGLQPVERLRDVGGCERVVHLRRPLSPCPGD